MSNREKLWNLINGLLNASYIPKSFCDAFSRIYDLEIDYDTLSEEEKCEFRDLSEMAGRFSDDAEELKIPHMYFSASEIINKAKHIKEKLGGIY